MIPPPVWLAPDKRYLVGISGGRDSIALHHWLVENNFKNITYCHLNHGLRGEESDGDEEFLRKLLGDNLIASHVNVAELARNENLSLETAARNARHHFFQECADQTGITSVLLAHHADDQAETILFNLLRGAAGLKGMKSQQRIGPLTILRPLLEVRRETIDQYLKARNSPYRDDSSNLEPFATRNRLRNDAIPLLSEIMQRDVSVNILRALGHYNELESATESYLANIELLDPQGRIHLPTFRKLPIALKKRSIYQFLSSHQIPELTSAHINEALEIAQPNSSPSMNLPGGQRLRRKESRLFIST